MATAEVTRKASTGFKYSSWLRTALLGREATEIDNFFLFPKKSVTNLQIPHAFQRVLNSGWVSCGRDWSRLDFVADDMID